MKNLSVVACLFVVTALLAAGLSCARPAPTPSPAASPAPKPAPTTSPKPAPKPTLTPSAVSPKAMSAADFYNNNVATIVVGYAPGGQNDLAARMVAAFWSDAFGGSARVKNTVGGGGIVATNSVFKANPDGLTIGSGAPGTALIAPTLLKQAGKEFDVAKFNYIGTYADELHVLAVDKKAPYNSVADLQKVKTLKLGCSARTGGPGVGSVMALQILGAEEGKVISGYSGNPEVALAISRKELDGTVYPASSMKSEADKGFVKPMAVIAFERSKVFPDLPAISEVVKLSPENEKLLKVYLAVFRSSRIFFTTPGVPADRVQHLRDSFDKLTKLKGFQDYVVKDYVVFSSASGKDAEAVIKEALAIPQTDVDKLNQVVNKFMK